MRIAVVGISYNPAEKENIHKLLDYFHKSGDEVYLYSQFFNAIKDDIPHCDRFHIFSDHNEVSSVELFVSLGGDGTFLHAARIARNTEIPILGINTGRLGYLTSTSSVDSVKSIARIKQKDFTIDRRSMLRVDTEQNLFGELNFALNDFTIYKRDSASMITVHVEVNGVFLNSYWGDGLIISTPTGSTAYNLSCGGPIVSSECDAFVITPVAPHNLSVRPLVISGNSIVTITPETRYQNYLAVLDSQSECINLPIKFTVKKENNSVNLVRFSEQSFPATIRDKLMWGADQRNPLKK